MIDTNLRLKLDDERCLFIELMFLSFFGFSCPLEGGKNRNEAQDFFFFFQKKNP